MAPKRTEFPPLGWRETSTINLGGQTTPITFCPHFHAPLADGRSKDDMIENPDGMVKDILGTAFLNFVNTSDTYRYIEGEPCVMHKYDITGGCSKSLTKTSIMCCSPRCRDGTRSARVCADHNPTKWKTTTDNPLLASMLEFTASKHTGKKGFVCAKCMLDAFDEQLTIIKRARIEYGWCVDTPDNHESIVAALDETQMQDASEVTKDERQPQPSPYTAPPAPVVSESAHTNTAVSELSTDMLKLTIKEAVKEGVREGVEEGVRRALASTR
ncbi:unnamed protein product [Vitrella brassicaformis CCMP3155]|uniref:Uncharacterized protein n=1 Tax=Vitrella brassicaformis (strain CCMP3155) TaxID=1169540 RepID=A0A0G4H5Y6_VITBC|nr:unnamed protein product [Vitrella brassicaformis CCMP3155]|eukprot:CEM39259.1 unnamed protein product [Vitrella brassicaformis CCMP3155]